MENKTTDKPRAKQRKSEKVDKLNAQDKTVQCEQLRQLALEIAGTRRWPATSTAVRGTIVLQLIELRSRNFN